MAGQEIHRRITAARFLRIQIAGAGQAKHGRLCHPAVTL